MEGLAMTLVKRSDRLWPAMPSLFDNLWSRDLMDWSNLNFSDTNTTLPAVNIKEGKDDFVIEVAAPGMSKNDFKINLENEQLVISSERNDQKTEENGEYSRREFSYQSFRRSFHIPNNMVDGEKISAKYNDGILTVVVPKRDEVKPKPPKEIKIA
jgi:HSP20 family protein